MWLVGKAWPHSPCPQAGQYLLPVHPTPFLLSGVSTKCSTNLQVYTLQQELPSYFCPQGSNPLAVVGTQKGLLGEIIDGSWIKSESWIKSWIKSKLLSDTQDGDAEVLPIPYLPYFLP